MYIYMYYDISLGQVSCQSGNSEELAAVILSRQNGKDLYKSSGLTNNNNCLSASPSIWI